MIGLDSTEEFSRSLNRYYELIEAGNARFNLTGATGWERVRDELFIRSLRFLVPVAGGHVPPLEWFEGRRILDIGTGAGIPGLVLKLAVPGMALTLLDSSRKKTAFLRDVVEELAIENVEVITGRAEEVGHDIAHREKYDLVVSRGVARLVELAELTLPFAAQGGAVVSAKGPDVDSEVEEAAWAAELLGAAPALTSSVSAPGRSQADTMVYYMKIGSTPVEYPRRTGVPHARPLLRGQSGAVAGAG